MTDEYLAEIKARYTTQRLSYFVNDNAKLIAHACTDVPALVAEVERMKDELADEQRRFSATKRREESLVSEVERLRGREVKLRELLPRYRTLGEEAESLSESRGEAWGARARIYRMAANDIEEILDAN